MEPSETNTVTYATLRSFRSAAAHYHKLDLQIAYPGQAYLDSGSRVLVSPKVSPTDEVGYALMSKGMSRRLGIEAKPSLALLDQHIRYLDCKLDEQFLQSTTTAQAQEICQAALANLIAWLGWLRAYELFHITWKDFQL